MPDLDADKQRGEGSLSCKVVLCGCAGSSRLQIVERRGKRKQSADSETKLGTGFREDLFTDRLFEEIFLKEHGCGYV